jgi:hypothetical protein
VHDSMGTLGANSDGDEDGIGEQDDRGSARKRRRAGEQDDRR